MGLDGDISFGNHLGSHRLQINLLRETNTSAMIDLWSLNSERIPGHHKRWMRKKITSFLSPKKLFFGQRLRFKNEWEVKFVRAIYQSVMTIKNVKNVRTLLTFQFLPSQFLTWRNTLRPLPSDLPSSCFPQSERCYRVGWPAILID